jgi:hypothetical protein
LPAFLWLSPASWLNHLVSSHASPCLIPHTSYHCGCSSPYDVNMCWPLTSCPKISFLILYPLHTTNFPQVTCTENWRCDVLILANCFCCPEVPEVPYGLRVLDKSGRSVQLSWAAPYDGNSPIKRYLIEYKISRGECVCYVW